MLSCQVAYLRHFAPIVTLTPFTTSRVGMVRVSPVHDASALTPNRLHPCLASNDSPHPDSSAASAMVKDAGIVVVAALACAVGPIRAMKSSGFI